MNELFYELYGIEDLGFCEEFLSLEEEEEMYDRMEREQKASRRYRAEVAAEVRTEEAEVETEAEAV